MALQDVNNLIDNNYAEVDLQMMLVRETGHIYMMDFEKVSEDDDEDDGLPKTPEKLETLRGQLKKRLGLT